MFEKKGKALVAMSGGVDSSVAALIAQESGYDCVGVTMKLFANEDVGETKDRPCCSLADAADAARAAAAVGIPHYVFDFSEDFRLEVMERFVQAYAKGQTPNPCIDCNTYIKYGSLYERLRRMGFDLLATGHYARIERTADGRFKLMRAKDEKKDQTYFLYTLTQEKLAHTLFPLGDFEKGETRALAAKAALGTAKKAESQDICFVSDSYADFIESYSGELSPAGNFVDSDGRVLGRHAGVIRYTIGQRKGLGIALGAPAYVSEIRAETREVVLAYDEGELFCGVIGLAAFSAISGVLPRVGSVFDVLIRYGAKPAKAEFSVMNNGIAVLSFEKPQRAPAKGQAAVLYAGDELIGGGRILWTRK